MYTRTAIAALLISFPVVVSAHVVVKPADAPIASYQTFTASVPSERESATVALRLLIPAGVENVTPSVKSGWTISTTKDERGTVTEIAWTGGRIPVERRDDFAFSARVPAETTTLEWKAYQTYADGTVVSWDMDPAMQEHNDAHGPYSVTRVSNDLDGGLGTMNGRASETATFVLAVAALATAGVALSRTRRPHHHS